MNFKKTIIMFILLILSLSLVACDENNLLGSDINIGELEENEEYEKVSGGELIVPINYVNTLNPLISSSTSMYYFNKLIFEGLFEFDKSLEPKALLVESYNINGDGSIDISIKRDIKWHDGKNLSSLDIKFTIDTIKYALANRNYENIIQEIYKSGGVSDISYIKDIYIQDDYNMTIYFENIGINILDMLTFPIIPKHRFDNSLDDDTVSYEKALQTDDYMPIGTGPYKKVKYDKQKLLELKVNKQYLGTKPHIETIKGKILKDEQLSTTAFESGKVDKMFSVDTNWGEYAQDDRVKISEFSSRQYEFLAFNFKDDLFKGDNGREIRKAIAYAIDKQAIIERVYLGHATRTEIPMHPNSWLVSKDIQNSYEYNVEKAKDILKKNGFDEENKLSIQLTTNSHNELRVRTIDIISKNLESIGIEVIKDYEQLNIDYIEEDIIESDWMKFEQKINRGNFQVALLGWNTSFIQDISFMFGSTQINGTNNLISYENVEMDKILKDINLSTSKDEKKKNYYKAQKHIVEELPYVSLLFTNGAVVTNKKIHGDINPNFTNIYSDIQEWFIPQKYQMDQ